METIFTNYVNDSFQTEVEFPLAAPARINRATTNSVPKPMDVTLLGLVMEPTPPSIIEPIMFQES